MIGGKTKYTDHVEFAVGQEYTTDGGTPVSYTHLDVYKRQVLRFLSNVPLPETEAYEGVERLVDLATLHELKMCIRDRHFAFQQFHKYEMMYKHAFARMLERRKLCLLYTSVSALGSAGSCIRKFQFGSKSIP